MEKPGIVQRVAEHPLTSLYIGAYLLNTVMFGESERYKEDPARELEAQLIIAYFANNNLSKPAQERFWTAYRKLPRQETKEYNLAAITNRVIDNLKQPLGFLKSLLYQPRTKQKTGMDLAEEFVRKDIKLETTQRFAERIFGQVEQNLYGLEEARVVNPADAKNHTLVETLIKTRGEHYDSLVVAVYMAVEETVKELGGKLGFEYKNDPWFNIFAILGDKNLIDYIVRDEIGGRWLDHEGPRDMLLGRHQHLELIAQKTEDPEACKDLLGTVSEDIRQRLIQRLIGFNPADLNGQLNTEHLSGLVKAYEQFAKSCCTETNGRLGKELLAISQYIRHQLYDIAIDLYFSKDSEKRKDLPRFKTLYKDFCLGQRKIFQNGMPDQEFEGMVQEDVDDLEKRAQQIKDEMINIIANRMERDDNLLAETFVEYIKSGQHKKGVPFPIYVIENAPINDEMDFSDLDALEELGTLEDCARDAVASMAMQDGGLFADVAGSEEDSCLMFAPDFYHPETGKKISRKELLAYYEKQESSNSE